MRKSKRGLIKSKPEYRIIWHTEAFRDLEKIEQYILQFSFDGAKKTISKILLAIDSLETNPERFQVDKELLNGFRRILVNQYKVIFEIDHSNKIVFILSVWNSKWNPSDFKRIAER